MPIVPPTFQSKLATGHIHMSIMFPTKHLILLTILKLIFPILSDVRSNVWVITLVYGLSHLFMLFLSSILRSVSPTFSIFFHWNYRNILRDHLKFEEVFSYIREMELQPGLDIITTYRIHSQYPTKVSINICSMHFVNFHPLQRDGLYWWNNLMGLYYRMILLDIIGI